MTTSRQSEVLIVGAGLAGLSAAVALSGAGLSTTLLERKPYVGGRAYSYPHPALGEVVDSQHVLLGCCTNLIDLCRMSGSDRHIRWYDDITFLEPSGNGMAARRSDIGPTFLPAPGHAAISFLRASMLSVSDKSRIVTGLLEFARGYPAQDDEPFSEWLIRTKQTKRSIRHFWEPVIVGALNDSFERCSTKYAGQVFYESFLKSAQGGRLGIPTLPLSEFYSATADVAQRQGTALRLRSSVTKVERSTKGVWKTTTSDGSEYHAPCLLLALPFEQTLPLLQTIPETFSSAERLIRHIAHFRHAPITTLHLWFDREITDLDHAALLDTRIQWMFNKSRIRRLEPQQAGAGEHYMELVISASFDEIGKTREQIITSALKELVSFFPSVAEARVVRSGILKEARATFSVTPGLDAFRPVAATDIADLFLAGDWTRTGWPATMEGAVRSGRLAADAIAKCMGLSKARESFVSRDAPPSGLMRLITSHNS